MTGKFTVTKEAPRQARAAVAEVTSLLDEDVGSDAVLLTSELVTNSVLHAGLASEDQIAVRIRVLPSLLRVDVLDLGRGFHRADVSQAREAGGWGFVLLDRISDRWGHEPGRPSNVWFEIDLPRETTVHPPG